MDGFGRCGPVFIGPVQAVIHSFKEKSHHPSGINKLILLQLLGVLVVS